MITYKVKTRENKEGVIMRAATLNNLRKRLIAEKVPYADIYTPSLIGKDHGIGTLYQNTGFGRQYYWEDAGLRLVRCAVNPKTGATRRKTCYVPQSYGGLLR
jgi:hypothetical protein